MLSYPYEHASSLIALNHYWISLSLIEVLDLTLSFFLWNHIESLLDLKEVLNLTLSFFPLYHIESLSIFHLPWISCKYEAPLLISLL